MSRATTPITPKYPTEPVFPLSVEQYHEMIRIGVLTDDDPVELIEGVLVFHMPKNPPHAFVLDAIQEVLRSLLPNGWMLRLQEPITLDDGEPEPDLIIARGSRRDYQARHPGPADAALVIEVADSTLARDRGTKLRSYARAGISEYWIVNVESRRIEVYTNPDSAAADPTYRNRVEILESGVVPVVIAGQPVGQLHVQAVLPDVG